jgi:16S rRNA (guanine527-N7)-methyltransferase
MTPDEAKSWLEQRVSRETMGHLEAYHGMLLRWQKTINLVAPSTLDAAWVRHFVDSAQLFDLAPADANSWVDMGSGGGFPGLVIAAMAAETRTDLKITLIESDIRKCGFMREAARAMKVRVNILSRRIADVPKQYADVVSARALSSLSSLISHAEQHANPGACLLFPKGESFQAELETLPPRWQTQAQAFESITDPSATIVRLVIPEQEQET